MDYLLILVKIFQSTVEEQQLIVSTEITNIQLIPILSAIIPITLMVKNRM